MMSLSQIARIVGGFKVGSDVTIETISNDTRTLDPGSLYIAIKGDVFDGHDFVEQAALHGAAAACTQEEIETNLPYILVENTRAALKTLAAYWREQFINPVIAVTGSCGKTTTRALLEAIFSLAGKTLASQKSFNNDIGVPLTLLRLETTDQYAILEMGMNHAGELAELTQIVQPDIAIITCIAPVHLAALKTLDNIAAAKAEIFEGLARNGKVIINNDDAYAEYFKKQAAQYAMLTFGIKNSADVMAKNIVMNENHYPSFQLITPSGQIAIDLPLMGQHNVMNALAAATAAVAQQLPLEIIKRGLETAKNVEQRLAEKRLENGALLIDDSYNANPTSVIAALEILAHKQGDSIFVFGDMLELGEAEIQYHTAIGEKAQALGIKQLYCYGDLAQHTAAAYGAKAKHFTNQKNLIAALLPAIAKDATVLVKGSKSMKMNNIVAALTTNKEK